VTPVALLSPLVILRARNLGWGTTVLMDKRAAFGTIELVAGAIVQPAGESDDKREKIVNAEIRDVYRNGFVPRTL